MELTQKLSNNIRIQKPVEMCFTLLVQGKTFHCSSRVIRSSQLFLDLVDFSDLEDNTPITLPRFIHRQIIQDYVEMVESGDWECSNLVLVSQSYLLDFLRAMDFLKCEKLKETVENKIKEKISDANWREIYDYSKNILGMVKTVRNVI